MIIQFADHPVVQFRRACEKLGEAIGRNATREELDRYQRAVFDARLPGLGDAIISSEEFAP